MRIRIPVNMACFTNSPFRTASPRPSRALQLPGYPVRDITYSRRRPHRHATEHPRLRGTRRSTHRHLSIQVSIHCPRGEAQARRVPLLLSHARNAVDPSRRSTRFHARHAPAQPQQACWRVLLRRQRYPPQTGGERCALRAIDSGQAGAAESALEQRRRSRERFEKFGTIRRRCVLAQPLLPLDVSRFGYAMLLFSYFLLFVPL